MKKKTMERFIYKSTRRMQILAASFVIVAAAILFGYYFGVVSPARASAFDGEGTGSLEDPYQITNCNQLQDIQKSSGSNYVLVNDVDCSDAQNWNDGLGFNPISVFSGNFDGRNFAIKNLYINRPTNKYVGLFASIEGNTRVENLRLTKTSNFDSRTDIVGAEQVGSLTGFLGDSTYIINISSDLDVQVAGPTDNLGENRVDMYAGGLIGASAGGRIFWSSSTGNVSVAENSSDKRDMNLGGFIGQYKEGYSGQTEAFITDSYSTGNVIGGSDEKTPLGDCGGFIGNVSVGSSGTKIQLIHNYSIGSVTCDRPTSRPASGAFVGQVRISSPDVDIAPEIAYNFATGPVSAQGRGFFGSYYQPNPFNEGINNPGTDFTTNKYDVTGTGASACGLTDVPNPLRDCSGVNNYGDQADYFSALNSDRFFYSWDQSAESGKWELSSPYPIHKVREVRSDPVANVNVTRDGSNFIVSWTAPVAENGRNGNIDGYQVYYDDASENGDNYVVYSVNAGANDTSITLEGLAIPGKYNFKVRALNNPVDNVEGLYSTAKYFATGMPAAAPIIQSSQAKAKSARLSWGVVEAATDYDVQYRVVGTDTWLDAMYSKTTNDSVVTAGMIGLEPQTSYEYRVTGKNIAGQGPWSDILTLTTISPVEYSISTCQQLQDIANDPEGNYILTGNIDCSNIENFAPIALFTGQLDGKGFSISNLSESQDININGSEIKAMGIFGITANATVKDITLKDSTVIANYTLDQSVDADQNGLPDNPVADPLDLTVIQPPDPGNLGLNTATNFSNDITTGLIPQVTQRVTDTAYAIPAIAQQFAKVSSGGIIGVAVAGGNFSNIKVLNTTVSGGLVGGVIGALLPISGFSNVPSIGAYADYYPPMTISGLQSSGIVAGNMAGGLIGAASSSLSGFAGNPGSLTIESSSSSSEVQANVGGGLVGTAISLSIAQPIIKALTSGGSIYPDQEFLDSLLKSGSTQDFIIKNSYATGKVSSCEATSSLRIGILGGLVGIGLGTSIESSYSTGLVNTCSGTTSNWGIYGGFMGGIGGVMASSRVTDSYSTGNIEAIENSGPDQYAPGIFVGATGGIAGLNITYAEDADGRYAIKNSHTSGNTTITGKQGLVGFSGGLTGIYFGSGTIKDSYSTGNITHVSPQQNLFSFSSAGGLTGLTFGADVPFLLKSAWNYPTLAPLTHGIDITNSYSSGNVVVQKNAKGGNLAVSGGLAGVFLGSGTIQSSHATGAVTNNLPDDVRISLRGIAENPDTTPTIETTSSATELYNFFVPALSKLGSSKYGSTVSGGLVGSGYGIDLAGIGSVVASGLSSLYYGSPSQENYNNTIISQGIVIDDSYSKGKVEGNLAGGIYGSADWNIKITKTYSDSDVEGAIVGGLIGQSGALTAAADFGIYTAAATIGYSSPTWLPNIKKVFEKGLKEIGTLNINNTYSTGKLTGTPGLAVIEGKAVIIGQEVNEFPAPGALPTTVGGLVGLSLSPARKITNSYSSGDILVKADPAYNVDPNWKIKFPKIPSFAGGIIGIDIALPTINLDKLLTDLIDTGGYGTGDSPEKYQSEIPELKNVFSVAQIKLSNSTLTGGADGLFVSPLPFVGKFILGYPSDSFKSQDYAKFDKVFIDKTRVSVEGCGGPNQLLSDLAQDFVGQLFLPTTEDNTKNVVDVEALKNSIDKDYAPAINPLLIKPACEYVNSNNSQPRYFIQNKVNEPLNNWDFNGVWKVVKDDYPKFVAGASTDIPSDGGGGGTPTNGDGAGSATGTSVVPVANPDQNNDIIRKAGRGVARKLGFVRQQEQVKGLKAFLARFPAFLAKSIPYSLILLLLILASMYSYQALREYRQLSAYHKSIMRIISTKESIDNYLAITTHYLNTPVAIMGGAVELLVSLKKISNSKAAALQGKVKKLGQSAGELLSANQVSNAHSANDEKLIRHDQPNPFKAKAVWIPAVIALGLIVLANALFIYADVFNKSPFRIVVELGLYALGVLLVGLAYRYRNYMIVTKEIAKQQLAMESQLYKKREAFIPEAIDVVSENYRNIATASESLKKVPESKLFFNGLAMLEGIKDGLVGIKKFANFEGEAPLFDISTYAQKAIHSASSKAADRNITFDAKISAGMLARIHPEEAKQLVNSLVDNAVKFSKDGGHIEVQAYKRFNKLVLSVSDHGVGISENKMPSLLKPFSRGTESMEYNYDGLGLSLYTDKIIVERMGGTISIRSKLGEGTVATITIPMSRDAYAIAPVLIMPEATA